MKTTQDMTKGRPLPQIVRFAAPILLTSILQQLYSLGDGVIAGRYLGVNAFAGVSATGSLNFLIIGFLLGMCSGCAIPVAQSFGENDISKLNAEKRLKIARILKRDYASSYKQISRMLHLDAEALKEFI